MISNTHEKDEYDLTFFLLNSNDRTLSSYRPETANWANNLM